MNTEYATTSMIQVDRAKSVSYIWVVSWRNTHPGKECFQNAYVYLDGEGEFFFEGSSQGRLLNMCVKGANIHDTYEDLLHCYNDLSLQEGLEEKKAEFE